MKLASSIRYRIVARFLLFISLSSFYTIVITDTNKVYQINFYFFENIHKIFYRYLSMGISKYKSLTQNHYKGIEWIHVDYFNNAVICDLIENVRFKS